MPYVMVDIEADGPIPGDYSMIALGAIVVEPALDRPPQTLRVCCAPRRSRGLRSDVHRSAAADLGSLGSGRTRGQRLLARRHARIRRAGSRRGLPRGCALGTKPRFVSDNNGFDWQFVCWYFHHFAGKNPFGFSSQNLGSLYKGLAKDMRASFKHLRKTKHTHDPLDDARGNAEAMLYMIDEMGLKPGSA